jgi:hypothetical protein
MLEDKSGELLKIRVIKVCELGVGNGRYHAECCCEGWYQRGYCLHSEFVRINIKKIEDRVECFEEKEEKRKDREERLLKEKKKKEKKERKRRKKEMEKRRLNK